MAPITHYAVYFLLAFLLLAFSFRALLLFNFITITIVRVIYLLYLFNIFRVSCLFFYLFHLKLLLQLRAKFLSVSFLIFIDISFVPLIMFYLCIFQLNFYYCFFISLVQSYFNNDRWNFVPLPILDPFHFTLPFITFPFRVPFRLSRFFIFAGYNNFFFFWKKRTPQFYPSISHQLIFVHLTLLIFDHFSCLSHVFRLTNC